MKINNIIFVFLIFNLIFISKNFSQNKCPFDAVDCYRGCGRYIDNNGDNFCDLGRLSKLITPVDTKKNITLDTNKVEIIVIKDTLKTDNNNKITNNKNKTNNNKTNVIEQKNDTILTVIAINYQPKIDSIISKVSFFDNNFLLQEKQIKKNKKPYDLIFISLLTFILYFFTLTLSKFNVLKKFQHRKIWNVLLLLTFLVSCLFGFFLVIQINYNFVMDWFRTVLYWHVQVGISMTIIAVLHILWHLKYFVNIVKKKS